jgi:hypothetical protein
MDGVKIKIENIGSIKNGLLKLYPRSRQVNAALQSSLKKAAKPLQTKLKQMVPKDQKKLEKSIKIFPSKRNTKAGRPSVFVGPKVERDNEGKKIRSNNPAEYFYILEYGFKPGGGDNKINGMGLLPKVTAAAGPQALKNIEAEVIKTLNKRSQKLFGKKLI